MKRASELADEERSMATLVELSSVFEGLASMRIAQVKDKVLQSTQFYKKLWEIYSQIKIGGQFSFGRAESDKQIIEKELMLLITSEGGFSGEIDQKLIRMMSKEFDRDKNDVIVIGHHGALQLAQAGIPYIKYFKMPSKDDNINVTPIIKEVKKYRSTRVFYQEYLSLLLQDVSSISLASAIHDKSESMGKISEVINEITYIFEPSTYEVVAHLESSMMQITVSQLILESKLAQYASRFQAMRMAHDRADETKKTIHTDYNRARRAVKDERLKEIINGMKKAKAGAV